MVIIEFLLCTVSKAKNFTYINPFNISTIKDE